MTHGRSSSLRARSQVTKARTLRPSVCCPGCKAFSSGIVFAARIMVRPPPTPSTATRNRIGERRCCPIDASHGRRSWRGRTGRLPRAGARSTPTPARRPRKRAGAWGVERRPPTRHGGATGNAVLRPRPGRPVARLRSSPAAAGPPGSPPAQQPDCRPPNAPRRSAAPGDAAPGSMAGGAVGSVRRRKVKPAYRRVPEAAAREPSGADDHTDEWQALMSTRGTALREVGR